MVRLPSLIGTPLAVLIEIVAGIATLLSIPSCDGGRPTSGDSLVVISIESLEGEHPSIVEVRTNDPAVWEKLGTLSTIRLLDVFAIDMKDLKLDMLKGSMIDTVGFRNCSGLRANAGAALAAMPFLVSLTIDECEADDGFYQSVSGSKTITGFNIEGTGSSVDEDALPLPGAAPVISRMPNLKTLSIARTRVSEEWCKELEHADKLYRLTFDGAEFGAQFTFGFIAPMKAMKDLYVNRCTGGAPDVFLGLKDAKQLRTLNLVDQDGITKELLTTLGSSLTNTTIEN